MKYLSVCSGIEAATAAWHGLGWKPVAFSEIEPFPCKVLEHHYPDVPNLGDITKFKEWPDYAIDVLVGGTPCQSFSVAGLRKGLADPRGNLMLTYLAIAERYRPTWLLWENVPGVLSADKGRAFGAMLGGLEELGYGWAYGVCDAQYFGVPQRRRRVFVVGHLGDWRCAAAVLFDAESLSGNPAPSREAGKGVAPRLAARTKGGGGLGTDFDCDGGLITETRGQDCVIPIQEIGKRQSGTSMNGVGHGNPGDPMFTLQKSTQHGVAVAGTLQNSGKAAESATQQDAEAGLLVTHSLGRRYDSSEDVTGRGTPLVACVGIDEEQNASEELMGCLKARQKGGGFEAAVAFSCKDNGRDASDQSPTLRSMNESGGNANGGGQVAVAFEPRCARNGRGMPDTVTPPLKAQNGQTGKGDGATCVATQMQVRRIMPVEAERLQGFPDGYTDIRPKGKPTPDGPRYKALGNSMAVPVMRWIGERIAMVDRLSGQAVNP